MIAREWEARCPIAKKDGFIAYLYETGVKDTSATEGFKGAQIFGRDINEETFEITLLAIGHLRMQLLLLQDKI